MLDEASRLERENRQLESDLSRAKQEESDLTSKIEAQRARWEAEKQQIEARFLDVTAADDPSPEIKQLRDSIAKAEENSRSLQITLANLDAQMRQVEDSLTHSRFSTGPDQTSLASQIRELELELAKSTDLAEQAEADYIKVTGSTTDQLELEREGRLVAFEKLRVRHSQLSYLRSIERETPPPPPDSIPDPDLIAQNEKKLQQLDSKLGEIVHQRLKLLKLRIEIAGHEFRRDNSAPSTNNDDVDLRLRIDQSRDALTPLEPQETPIPVTLRGAFEELQQAKEKLIGQQFSYFKSQIKAYQRQMEIVGLKATTGAEKSFRTQKRYQSLYSKMLETSDQLQAAIKKATVGRERLEAESLIYERYRPEQGVLELEGQIQERNNGLVARIGDMKSQIEMHVDGINRICAKLKIPVLQEGETAKHVFQRMQERIAVLKSPKKSRKEQGGTLEEQAEHLREENARLKYKQKNIADQIGLVAKKE
jgi:chromosome segregation ATPase